MDDFITAARQRAICGAREIIAARPLYLDTETTGLGEDAQICDIAIVDSDGVVVLNTLVRPTCPIPAEATAVHGITNEMVADAPPFSYVFHVLAWYLNHHVAVTYNAAYDSRMILQSCQGFKPADNCHFDYRCAMRLFAEFYGDWNDYRQSFRWQKLEHAARHCGYPTWEAHRALGDTLAARAVMLYMASAAE